MKFRQVTEIFPETSFYAVGAQSFDSWSVGTELVRFTLINAFCFERCMLMEFYLLKFTVAKTDEPSQGEHAFLFAN